MGKVYAVGVGPGSPKYVTEIVKEIVENCDVIIGYKYTLKTIENLIQGKEIYEITMNDQEESYQKIKPELKDRTLVIPFTGDVNFSESEVVDRLIEIFGKVEIVPGISSIQVAASKAQVPLDKSKVITMHVTTPIEDKKLELQKALIDGFSVVLVPRPWPKQPDKHFMPSEIAGLGLFATTEIPIGTDLGTAHVQQPGGGYHVTELGHFHNHSYEPNCINVMKNGKRNLFAIRNIFPY